MKVIDTGIKTAIEQMQQDEELLKGVDVPTVRFYQFFPRAVTYGYFIKPDLWLKTDSGDVARRPTGGGLIFHEEDFSFTVALPLDHPITKLPTLQRYQLINNQLLRVLNFSSISMLKHRIEDGIDQLCMANPTEYDLMYKQKKIAGAAQRKNRQGFIHQCSLFLLEPTWERIASDLIDPEHVMPKLQACTGGLFQTQVPEEFRQKLKNALVEKFDEFFSFGKKACTPPHEQVFF